ncbi:hypothetical protein GIB67_031496, partial [Kingdonia uniflora]
KAMPITPPFEGRQVSFLKACIHGVNALSGIGILSIPYALSQGGWLSIILLLVIGATAWFTALLLRRCMDAHTHIKTYPDIAEHAFGPRGRIVVAIFSYLELYLVSTGLLIVEGDNLNKLAPHFALRLGRLKLKGQHSFILLSGFAILPSMWLNDMSMLSYVSAGGVISSIILMVSILCVGATSGVGFHGESKLMNIKGLPTALSLYIFCYGAHGLFPTMYSSMKERRKFSKVLLLSFVLSTGTNILMAILGYLMYGKNVQSQVTLNLPIQNLSSKIAIYTTLAGPIAKYALMMAPLATALESRVPASYKHTKLVTILIRTALLFSTVVLAIVFPFFGFLMALVGSCLIVLISFLLPCVCYLKISGAYKNVGYEVVGIVGIMLIAVLVGVVGTYSSLAQSLQHVHTN